MRNYLLWNCINRCWFAEAKFSALQLTDEVLRAMVAAITELDNRHHHHNHNHHHHSTDRIISLANSSGWQQPAATYQPMFDGTVLGVDSNDDGRMLGGEDSVVNVGEATVTL